MPRFILLAAVSLDGRITKGDEPGSDWTSPEDKEFLHQELDRCDAVIVGRTTYEAANEPLSKRRCFVFTNSVSEPKQMSENLTLINPAKLDIREYFRDYKNIAVLGGTQTYDYFLEKKLADEFYLTVEPVAFGSGKTLFSKFNPVSFYLKSSTKLNQNGTILLHYIKGGSK